MLNNVNVVALYVCDVYNAFFCHFHSKPFRKVWFVLVWFIRIPSSYSIASAILPGVHSRLHAVTMQINKDHHSTTKNNHYKHTQEKN